MELNIVVFGPKTAATDQAIKAAQTSWGNHAYRLNYFFNQMLGADPNRAGVYWVEGDIPGNYRIIEREFSNFSPAYIEAKTLAFLKKYGIGPGDSKVTDPGSSKDDSGTQRPSTPEKGGNLGIDGFFGLGIFNLKLPGNLPSWVWLIGAGFAGMKFFDTSNKLGKVAYGGAAAFCTLNYLNNAKIPIKLPKIPFIGAAPQPPKRLLL